MTEEADLAELVADGDAAAFDRMVAQSHGRIARLAYRLLGWDGDVEDLVQEVYLAAWQGRQSLQKGSDPTAWLIGITVNKCRARRRLHLFRWRHRHRVERSIPTDSAGGADGPAISQEVFEQVRSAIQSLPGSYRDVVVLRYLEQMPCDSIARVLGLSTSAVEVRLHRARKKLKRQLEGLCLD